jgi:hypothetical protein
MQVTLLELNVELKFVGTQLKRIADALERLVPVPATRRGKKPTPDDLIERDDKLFYEMEQETESRRKMGLPPDPDSQSPVPLVQP